MDVTDLGEQPVAEAVARLRRVEGQVQALQRMLHEGRDCEEVLRQVAAATKALRRVGVGLAVSGLERCALDDHGDGPSPEQRAERLERFRRAFVELS